MEDDVLVVSAKYVIGQQEVRIIFQAKPKEDALPAERRQLLHAPQRDCLVTHCSFPFYDSVFLTRANRLCFPFVLRWHPVLLSFT